jgi:diacylglycerol O-acyltransferase / wax synthase
VKVVWESESVADRLTSLDASFLYMEDPSTPMHVGGVAVFATPTGGFQYDTLVDLIARRIAHVPRYRQRVRHVPGKLAGPLWIDDTHFDISYHVRKAALPRPGGEDQLRELVARIQSRSLDRQRPLWEVYLVEGLCDDRFAIITKTHQAMVDGVAAIDLGQVILDAKPTLRANPIDPWCPEPEPTGLELLAGAVADVIRRPTAALEVARATSSDLRIAADWALSAAGGLFAVARSTARPAPSSPLNVSIGGQRRWTAVRTELARYRAIRDAHGGTVNDVILAVLSGALRSWLLTRGEPITSASVMRALLPVSVRASKATENTQHAVSTYLVDLPVGEASPIIRLHRVSYAMAAHEESGQAIGAAALAAAAGFTPPTMHALGARAVSSLSRRLFNLVVTNVPGPQYPLYAAGARMVEVYPVVPLAPGQAASVGLTSYNGGVYYGLNTDRDALPDVDVLAQCISDALDELSETAR